MSVTNSTLSLCCYCHCHCLCIVIVFIISTWLIKYKHYQPNCLQSKQPNMLLQISICIMHIEYIILLFQIRPKTFLGKLKLFSLSFQFPESRDLLAKNNLTGNCKSCKHQNQYIQIPGPILSSN